MIDEGFKAHLRVPRQDGLAHEVESFKVCQDTVARCASVPHGGWSLLHVPLH
jgi:hypothetical protein